jgi:Uma2 family endonuclease
MLVTGDVRQALFSYLGARASQVGVDVLAKQRIQASRQHPRTPDICVVVGRRPDEKILSKPPFLCIEVASKSTKYLAMQHRVDDYLTFGVPNVWLIVPESRRAWRYTTEGAAEAKDGVLRTENPSIEVLLAEVFAGLDDAGS